MATANWLRSAASRLFSQAGGIVSARAPRPNLADTTNQFTDSTSIATPSNDVTWQRIVGSDPRDLWFLALPSKLLPKQVEQIKRAGLGGDAWQTWQLEALMADSWPMYRKCAHEIRQAVSNSKYVVRPHCEDGKEPTPSALDKAELVRRAMHSMKPNRFTDEKSFKGMVYHLTDALINGVSMVELQWHRVGVEKLPRAASWVHPRHYTFDSSGIIKVTPLSDVGATLQFGYKRTTGLDDDTLRQKFLCSQFTSKSGSSLSAGLMRPLATWWSYWVYGREWIAVMAQKYGTPFVKGKYTPGSTSQEEQNRIESKMRDAGANNYLLTPTNVEVEIIAAQTLGSDNPIVHLMRQADEAPQYLLLGQTSTTTATPGKLGGSGEHADVKREHVEALSGWVGEVLTDQFSASVIEANYGVGNADEIPVIEADFSVQLGPQEQAARWTQLCGPNMPPVLASEYYKDNNLTEPQPGDVVIQHVPATIFEKPMTEEEKFNQDLERQVTQAEAQIAVQGEANAGLGVQAGARSGSSLVVRGHVPDLRSALAKATDDELEQLEKKIVAAERAAHFNGEAKAVEVKVKEISTKRF